MDSEGMLSVHMFGDVQTMSHQEIESLEGITSQEYAEAMLINSRGAYAFDRELTGKDPYQDLITLIENRHGDWSFRILDRYTEKALWSRADEHGAHNALELIEAEIASENI